MKKKPVYLRGVLRVDFLQFAVLDRVLLVLLLVLLVSLLLLVLDSGVLLEVSHTDRFENDCI